MLVCKQQNNPLVSVETVCHSSAYIILYIQHIHYLSDNVNICDKTGRPNTPTESPEPNLTGGANT